MQGFLVMVEQIAYQLPQSSAEVRKNLALIRQYCGSGTTFLWPLSRL